MDERSRTSRTTVAAIHDAMTLDRAGDVVFRKPGEIAYAGRKSGIVDRFLGESVLEVHTGGLSEAEVGTFADCAAPRWHRQAVAVWGRRTLLGMPDLGIGQRSIPCTIRPTDMMAWIDARKSDRMSALVLFELKSCLSSRMAMFRALTYPDAMLVFLAMVFDPGVRWHLSTKATACRQPSAWCC